MFSSFFTKRIRQDFNMVSSFSLTLPVNF